MKRKKIVALKKILAFCDGNFEPSEKAVQMFFDYTDKGIRPDFEYTYTTENTPHGVKITWTNTLLNELNSLVLGHHMMSGAQRNMWLEGQSSGYDPIRVVLLDYLIFFKENPEEEKRFYPAFDLALTVSAEVHDTTKDFEEKQVKEIFAFMNEN